MSTSQVPAHVPPELVVDFNYFDQPGGHEDPHLTWKKLHDGPDVFYSPHYDGHWVITRGEDLREILNNHGHFSSTRNSIPYHRSGLQLAPIEYDPPDQLELKRLQIPSFQPSAINTLEEDSRKLSIELIESFHDRGECEFVSEFALKMPIGIFMRMMNIPDTERLYLLELVETLVRGKDENSRLHAHAKLIEYSEMVIEQRRQQPGNDLVSQLLRATFKGKPLEQKVVLGFVVLLWSAGLDTVSSAMGFIARFLANNPSHRRQLIEQPELIQNAIEELLRRFGVSIPSRVVTEDLVFKGITMKKGDMVLLPVMMQGMDERVWKDPMKVDFNRPDAGMHLTFGGGVHRCSGSYLARTELRVFIEEWLRLIPDFTIKAGDKPVTSVGVVNGTLRLPLAWNV